LWPIDESDGGCTNQNGHRALALALRAHNLKYVKRKGKALQPG
jgi:hypothetical protein